MCWCDILSGMETLRVRDGVATVEKALRLRLHLDEAEKLDMLLAAANNQKFMQKERQPWIGQALETVIGSASVSDLGKTLKRMRLDAARTASFWLELERERDLKIYISEADFGKMFEIAREHSKMIWTRERSLSDYFKDIENADRQLVYDRLGLNVMEALEGFAGGLDGAPMWGVALLSPLEAFCIFANRRLYWANPPLDTIGYKPKPFFEPVNLPKVSIEEARALVLHARKVVGLGDYF